MHCRHTSYSISDSSSNNLCSIVSCTTNRCNLILSTRRPPRNHSRAPEDFLGKFFMLHLFSPATRRYQFLLLYHRPFIRQLVRPKMWVDGIARFLFAQLTCIFSLKIFSSAVSVNIMQTSTYSNSSLAFRSLSLFRMVTSVTPEASAISRWVTVSPFWMHDT